MKIKEGDKFTIHGKKYKVIADECCGLCAFRLGSGSENICTEVPTCVDRITGEELSYVEDNC